MVNWLKEGKAPQTERVKRKLFELISKEARELFGLNDGNYFRELTNIYINDDINYDGCLVFLENSKFSKKFSINLKKTRILDIGCGWGTSLIYGLKKGYNVFGIDISQTKKDFFRFRIGEMGYKKGWLSRYILANCESLPFRSSSFDIIIANQTLEHIENLSFCIKEIFRVLKEGGIFYIRAPDYRSFFEPHYRILWAPFLRGKIAEIYIKTRRKPKEGLRQINFITKPRLIKELKRSGFSEIIDLNREIIWEDRKRKIQNLLERLLKVAKIKVSERMILKVIPRIASILNLLYELLKQISMIGKSENQIHVLALKYDGSGEKRI